MTLEDLKRIRKLAQEEEEFLGDFWPNQVRALCDEVQRLMLTLLGKTIEEEAIEIAHLTRQRNGARAGLIAALKILARGLDEFPRESCRCRDWRPCWLHGDAIKLLGVASAGGLKVVD